MHLLVLDFISISQKLHHFLSKDCFSERIWQINDCHQLYSDLLGSVLMSQPLPPAGNSEQVALNFLMKDTCTPNTVTLSVREGLTPKKDVILYQVLHYLKLCSVKGESS